jgi:hypothetical protein
MRRRSEAVPEQRTKGSAVVGEAAVLDGLDRDGQLAAVDPGGIDGDIGRRNRQASATDCPRLLAGQATASAGIDDAIYGLPAEITEPMIRGESQDLTAARTTSRQHEVRKSVARLLKTTRDL